jgi:hypothetical protein
MRIVFYLAGPFGLSMPSPGDGESGARARLAFRILRLEPFEDEASVDERPSGRPRRGEALRRIIRCDIHFANRA